jgi:hypothetical protein
MKYRTKFFSLVLCIVGCIILQAYAPSIGKIDIDCAGLIAHIEIYAVIASILIIFCSWITLKSILFAIYNCPLWRHKRTDEEIANILASLILSEDREFTQRVSKIEVPRHLQVIKTSITLLRWSDDNKIEITDSAEVDIVNVHIIKRDLREYLRQGKVIESIKLANKAIDKYPKHTPIVRDEILEVALLAKRNQIGFRFDPRKFKYNLDPQFIEKYYVSVQLLEFHLEYKPEIQIKILEKAFDNYPANLNIVINFLEIITIQDVSDEMNTKIIDIIKRAFPLNPNRIMAYYLLKTDRKDLFEIVQTIVSFPTEILNDSNGSMPYDIIEKAWFMLIISTKLNLISKAREIIKLYLADQMNAADLAKFYVQNHNVLSKDEGINELIRETCNEYQIYQIQQISNPTKEGDGTKCRIRSGSMSGGT